MRDENRRLKRRRWERRMAGRGEKQKKGIRCELKSKIKRRY